VLEPFSYVFAQRGLVEVLALAVAGGTLGTWIVLRGLAFYAHAVAAAAFPGLVLAEGLGFAALLGALGTGALFALVVGRLAVRRADGYDTLTALTLVGALAVGIVLASDVFGSGAQVDTLLFGSLLSLRASDLVFAGAVALASVIGSALLGPRWLAAGFDPVAARASGLRAGPSDLALLAVVALAAVAALAAVGSLLATSLLVVPAVTTRLWCRRVGTWQATTVAVAAAEGVAGVWLSVQLNAPPGPTIATLAALVFAVVAVERLLAMHRVRSSLAIVSE
jgi:ABC-type Mn2+/Zn2+ transport system permease subunit